MIKKIIKISLLIIVLAIFGYTIFFLYQKSQTPPVVFQTVSPFDTVIVKKTVATGSIIPRKEVNMKSRVSGVVEKFFVVAGQEIKEGDVIARIKIIPNMASLQGAETRINQAKVSFDNATIEYERNKKLLEQGVISKADFLPSDLKYKSAEVEVKSAEDNLQILKEGVSKSMETASNTIVKSTIRGMVLDVPIKEGSSVIESNTFNEGTTIAVVANMGEMIFEGKLDESEVGKVKEGMPLVLTVGAIDNETFNANLEYIAPKGVAENGAIQFLIRAAMNKEKNSTFLRAAYSASADIILAKKENVLAIPESVMQFEKSKAFVEIEKSPNMYEKKYIKTGLSDGINIEVLEGLTKKDKIKIPLLNAPPADKK
ncbi:MAG TPA: efflux RND transporter periplasmic adaptor subunit [Bacteroidia bacterium]|jgi:HlyD family secretion protein|nr:efflux RND transporter periplasmic adaptor subunit [Bacteroidia bacterium]